MKRITAVLLCLLLMVSCLAGCGNVVGEIAGNVADAAKEELEAQVKATFQKYKVEILELRTAVGKLNGNSGDIQFFCAALVASDSPALPQSVADGLNKVFHDAGITEQTDAKVVSAYLEHKGISYQFSDFGNGKTYYTVWCYTDKLPELSDLATLTEGWKSADGAKG